MKVLGCEHTLEIIPLGEDFGVLFGDVWIGVYHKRPVCVRKIAWSGSKKLHRCCGPLSRHRTHHKINIGPIWRVCIIRSFDFVEGQVRNVNLKQATEEVDRVVLRMGYLRPNLVSLYRRIAKSCNRFRTELLNAIWYIVLRTKIVLCALPENEGFKRRSP